MVVSRNNARRLVKLIYFRYIIFFMTNKTLEFRAMDEFEKHYFPKEYERKMIEQMTPKELGRYLAQQTLDYIRRHNPFKTL